MSTTTAGRISLTALRGHVIATQAFATRARNGDADAVEATIRRLSCVQLDSISTVDRSHRLVLVSRVGRYPRRTVTGLLADGRVFEYWAHEACLVPIEDFPTMRRRMVLQRDHPWWGPVIDRDPDLAAHVLGEIRERGPLGSRHFDGPRGEGMWDLKPAKRMLEALWTAGELVIGGREGFQRLYDLPERVIPRTYLDARVPDRDEALRAMVERAVRARGALTDAGAAEHYRIAGGARRVRPAADALVGEGRLRRLDVDDGGASVLVPADVEIAEAPAAGSVLLSPFENMLWDRAFAARLFGFRHVIEVYKRPPEREYGYYVLPLLAAGRIVGRADMKADRAAGVLRVLAFHREPRVRASGALDRALAGAVARLARALGLSAEP